MYVYSSQVCFGAPLVRADQALVKDTVVSVGGLWSGAGGESWSMGNKRQRTDVSVTRQGSRNYKRSRRGSTSDAAVAAVGVTSVKAEKPSDPSPPSAEQATPLAVGGVCDWDAVAPSHEAELALASTFHSCARLLVRARVGEDTAYTRSRNVRGRLQEKQDNQFLDCVALALLYDGVDWTEVRASGQEGRVRAQVS